VAIRKIEKITAWSYSRWATYRTCAYKAKLKFIDKLPEPSGPAAERGTLIHALAQSYLEGMFKKLPEELKLFKEEFKELKKGSVECEGEWAFTRTWQPTGWFAADVFCRIKTDAYLEDRKGHAARVVDFKTGKVNEEHITQLELYALGAFLRNPHLRAVTAELWYLDKGVVEKREFEQGIIPTLKDNWVNNTRAMLVDTRFAPTPSAACRWCHFRKDNGGPCKF